MHLAQKNKIKKIDPNKTLKTLMSSNKQQKSMKGCLGRAPIFTFHFQPRLSCLEEYFISTPHHKLSTNLFEQSWVEETTLAITLL